MNKKRNYGWKPDLPDNRDHIYGSIFPRDSRIKPPEAVDLRKYCSPVENQGQTSSCTAHALTGAYELMQRKGGKPAVELSRLFLYWNERVMEKSTNRDSGAMIRDGIKSLTKQGCCDESLWAFNESAVCLRPVVNCYTEALNHQLKNYQRLNILNDMLSCLADGFPFVFGFSVYESFESDEVAKTGIMPIPEDKERLLGGHAILCCGYNITKRQLIIKNSWSAEWGQAGYFMMPFDIVTNRNFSDDFWSFREVE